MDKQKLNVGIKIKPAVTIVGLGYVGRPLLQAVVESGKFFVTGYDIDEEQLIRVDALLKQSQQRYRLTSVPETCLPGSDIVVVCVPTPVSVHRKPRYSYVINVVRTISRLAEKNQTIIIESTVGPGTCRKILSPILAHYSGSHHIRLQLAHCPERINPGDSHWGIHNIPRNIGGITREASMSALSFYSAFVHAPISVMRSIEEAESTKLVENIFRDVNIALANELAMFFTHLKVDYLDVLRGVSSKPFSFIPHIPGCGVGGDCIPTASYFLMNTGNRYKQNLTLMQTARNINNGMIRYTVGKFLRLCKQTHIKPEEANVSVLGLSYKEDIADIRNSPAVRIAAILKRHVRSIQTYDPYVPSLSSAINLQTALVQTDAVVICTAHKEFVRYLPESLPTTVKFVLDGRNCIDATKITRKNIIYSGIGRE